MNETGIMREYVNLLSGKEVVKESIESGMIDVIDGRLKKTMGMIENLIAELAEDAPQTTMRLEELVTTLDSATKSIYEIRSYWDSEVADEEITIGPVADDNNPDWESPNNLF